MALLKTGWSEALEPGIREWFFNGYSRRISAVAGLYRRIESTKSAEHFHSFGAISPDAWDNFKKSGQIPSVSYDDGYKTTLTNDTYMVKLPVQRELIEDNQYSEVLDQAFALGDSAAQRLVNAYADTFNNAFDSNFTGGDGVSLCSDSHPNSPRSSVTQDNSYALTLSSANMETVRQNMMAFTDDVGGLANVRPDLIIVPPGLEKAAAEFTESELKPGSMDNDINFERRFRYMVDHYLTDSNAWFMVDSVRAQRSLLFVDRIPLNIYRENSDDSVFMNWIARMRWATGWRDWRWIAGSNPS